MAQRAGTTRVIVVIVLLAGLAVSAPVIARGMGPALNWLLTFNNKPKVTHNMAAKVWVNERSGLFYCRSSKFFGKAHPGFETQQGSALQKGYRPISGGFCR